MIDILHGADYGKGCSCGHLYPIEEAYSTKAVLYITLGLVKSMGCDNATTLIMQNPYHQMLCCVNQQH